MIRIGYQYHAYPEQRNILNKVAAATYIRVYSAVGPIEKVLKRIRQLFGVKKKLSTQDIYSFKGSQFSNIDLLHFFNSMYYGDKDWGVTFETVVPFHEEYKMPLFLRGDIVEFNNRKEFERLAMKNCKFLVAISQCAFDLQIEYLKPYPILQEVIKRKMTVLHPPQELLVKDYHKPEVSLGINFMFIGNEFLRKGGISILKVFDKLKDKFPNFKLILIGDYEKYGFNRIPSTLADELREVVRNNSDRIQVFKKMPNPQALELMVDQAHVGLLPTQADTYGYSVLEFQAAGCPVISTNVRALPEINNTDCGWLIEVPKSNLGHPLAKAQDEIELLQQTITDQLYNIIIDILENPNSIKKKAVNSIERIRKEHSPEAYSKRLSELYGLSD